MNLLEAGVLPSVPLGATAGGMLCKPYGVLPTIGGALVGGIVGGLAGFLYGLFIIALMAIIAGIWGSARGEPEVPEDVIAVASKSARLPIILSALLGGMIVLVASWCYGVSYVVLMASVIAFLAVRKGRLHVENEHTDS